MPDSLYSTEFQAVMDAATAAAGGRQKAFPSPADWRDEWIYFLMIDRFNNASALPNHTPFDDPDFSAYQGGKFSGVQAKLDYIKGLGAGAIWLSPVLKNSMSGQGSYHGYGIQDFLAANPFFADDPAKADDELRALVDAAHAKGLYVIFDIVLNHTADVFAYARTGTGEAPYSDARLDVEWRDKTGKAMAAWTAPAADRTPSRDELIWPKELQQNEYFRRQGDPAPSPADDTVGDFPPFKQLATWENDVQRYLIRAYQYVIARWDVDGFRIDTLRYLKGDLPQMFGNSMREFALSIGKKNFFTFGEVWDNSEEDDIAKFIGRNTDDAGDKVGVDAALDYPLFRTLGSVVRGQGAPQRMVAMYQYRKRVEQKILSSHGDATRFFVTFLDNHDTRARIRPDGSGKPDDAVRAGLACLMTLPGIPCIYYGTEQGLHGAGSDPAVREALWGGPGFGTGGAFYTELAKVAGVRAEQAALRYGRFYFRPISGNGTGFGISTTAPGLLAFSRILNDQEVVIVANFNAAGKETVWVIVEDDLCSPGDRFGVLYSNLAGPAGVGVVTSLTGVRVVEVDGTVSAGPVSAIQVTVRGGEALMLRKE